MASPNRRIKAPTDARDAIDLLVEASSALLSNLQVSAVLPKVVGEAKKLISADAYAVWVADAATGTWHIAACDGLSEEYRCQELNSSTGGMMPKEPLVVPNVGTHPFVAHRRVEYEREGIRALLVVPIMVQDVVQGTISFYYRGVHAISEREIRYASAIANLAGLALRTAQVSERQEIEKRRSAFLA